MKEASSITEDAYAAGVSIWNWLTKGFARKQGLNEGFCKISCTPVSAAFACSIPDPQPFHGGGKSTLPASSGISQPVLAGSVFSLL